MNFNRICELLNKEPNCQCSIEHTETVGDSHNRGKSAIEVWLNFGSITKKTIYKPRGSDILKTYAEYCSQFNAYSTLKIFPVKSISSGESCWVEFINFQQCDSEEQVKKYYESLGCLLANMFFLRGIDVHFENIIACFDMPYLVDHECIFSPALSKEQEMISLDDTLIISSKFKGNNNLSIFDASAFGKPKEQTLPINSLNFEFDEEDYIRFSKKPIKINAQKNIPKLHGEFVNPEKYTEEFLEGFKVGYCCIMRLKENIERNLPVPLKFKTNKVRVLIKPTLFYRKLLQESFHPLLLMNHQSEIYFLQKQLSRQPIYHSYIDSEIDQILNGDIPYFAYSPKNNAIVGDTGIIGIPECLAFDCIKKQVDKFSLTDLEYHLNKIRESISTK